MVYILGVVNVTGRGQLCLTRRIGASRVLLRWNCPVEGEDTTHGDYALYGHLRVSTKRMMNAGSLTRKQQTIKQETNK